MLGTGTVARCSSRIASTRGRHHGSVTRLRDGRRRRALHCGARRRRRFWRASSGSEQLWGVYLVLRLLWGRGSILAAAETWRHCSLTMENVYSATPTQPTTCQRPTTLTTARHVGNGPPSVSVADSMRFAGPTRHQTTACTSADTRQWLREGRHLAPDGVGNLGRHLARRRRTGGTHVTGVEGCACRTLEDRHQRAGTRLHNSDAPEPHYRPVRTHKCSTAPNKAVTTVRRDREK